MSIKDKLIGAVIQNAVDAAVGSAILVGGKVMKGGVTKVRQAIVRRQIQVQEKKRQVEAGRDVDVKEKPQQ